MSTNYFEIVLMGVSDYVRFLAAWIPVNAFLHLFAHRINAGSFRIQTYTFTQHRKAKPVLRAKCIQVERHPWGTMTRATRNQFGEKGRGGSIPYTRHQGAMVKSTDSYPTSASVQHIVILDAALDLLCDSVSSTTKWDDNNNMYLTALFLD